MSVTKSCEWGHQGQVPGLNLTGGVGEAPEVALRKRMVNGEEQPGTWSRRCKDAEVRLVPGEQEELVGQEQPSVVGPQALRRRPSFILTGVR